VKQAKVKSYNFKYKESKAVKIIIN